MKVRATDAALDQRGDSWRRVAPFRAMERAPGQLDAIPSERAPPAAAARNPAAGEMDRAKEQPGVPATSAHGARLERAEQVLAASARHRVYGGGDSAAPLALARSSTSDTPMPAVLQEPAGPDSKPHPGAAVAAPTRAVQGVLRGVGSVSRPVSRRVEHDAALRGYTVISEPLDPSILRFSPSRRTSRGVQRQRACSTCGAKTAPESRSCPSCEEKKLRLTKLGGGVSKQPSEPSAPVERELDEEPQVQRACAMCNTKLDQEEELVQRAASPQIQSFSLEQESADVFGGDTTQFMLQLRERVTEVSNEELADVGRTADQCPYIHHWLSFYEGVSAPHLDRAIQRYARPPERSAAAYQDAVVSRVRSAIQLWKTTGHVGVPSEASAAAPRPVGSDLNNLPTSLGAGQELEGGLRSRLESAYGHDLGAVRVHTGERAADMTQRVSALAFTVGSDIAFARGQYRPGSTSGDLLIAHEVAHTIQQGGRVHEADTIGDTQERALEQEADVAAAQAVTGQTANVEMQTGSASGLSLQRCDAISADCTQHGPSGLRLEVEKFRECGLLDPPFRPAGVDPFPEYRPEDDLSNKPLDPSCFPMEDPFAPPLEASLGASPETAAMGKLVQAQPVPIPRVVPRPVPRFVPRVVPKPSPPPELPAPAPAPQPGPGPLRPPVPIAPRPGAPEPRPDDQEYLDRLSPEQIEFYRMLREAQSLRPTTGENPDELPNQTPEPAPEPENERDEEDPCIAFDTPRRGGHKEHDAYATLKSSSPFDYFAQAPNNDAINYDGRTARTTLVWEVKVGHGWFFNCKSASLRDLVLKRWDAQKNRGLSVARQCGYDHIWACKDKWVAALLTQRWQGKPLVTT